MKFHRIFATALCFLSFNAFADTLDFGTKELILKKESLVVTEQTFKYGNKIFPTGTLFQVVEALATGPGGLHGTTYDQIFEITLRKEIAPHQVGVISCGVDYINNPEVKPYVEMECQVPYTAFKQ